MSRIRLVPAFATAGGAASTTGPSRPLVRRLAAVLWNQGSLGLAAGLLGFSALSSSGTLAGFQASTTNSANVFNAGYLRMTNVAGTAQGASTDCTAGATAG